MIWKVRNRIRFQGNLPDYKKLEREIEESSSRTYAKSKLNNHYIQNERRDIENNSPHGIYVKCFPPPLGILKLKMDRSSKGNLGKAGGEIF